MSQKAILLIGTFDTKPEELSFMMQVIQRSGCDVVAMDVSVLGDTDCEHQITKHQVAEASGMTIKDIIAYGDENLAMQKMSEGAQNLTVQYYQQGKIHGAIALGGSMGTDLALDVMISLPVGVPKMIVSTVAFSQMIPVERIPADVMMTLWAGGLYGMGDLCMQSLLQACGAICGSVQSLDMYESLQNQAQKPRVAITSLGKSCLQYMVYLTPELEKRGYDVSVFHATGMGGQAFENLVQQGYFCAVFDFCLQEVSNYASGLTPIHAGAHRMYNAGHHNIPQIISIGATDLIDLVAWDSQDLDFSDRDYHQHNRLISSVNVTAQERQKIVEDLKSKLQTSHNNTVLLLPEKGIQEWDKQGQPMHNPQGLSEFISMLEEGAPKHIQLETLPYHINDPAFSQRALEIFDMWVAQGVIPKPN